MENCNSLEWVDPVEGNTRISGVEAIILRVSNDGDRDTFRTGTEASF